MAFCFVLGCGGEPLGEDISQTTSPILAGTDDDENRAVLALRTRLPTGEEICTGYLVMPDLVLTARHCVAPVVEGAVVCSASDPSSGYSGGAPIPASNVRVSAKANARSETAWLPVAEIVTLPDSEGAQLCGRDLALLRLASPIGDVTPIALALTAPPAVGSTFTAVGYGMASPGKPASSGQRRSRSGLTVSFVGAGDRTVDEEWIAETGPCGGDSGGPALDASGASFGVMSRGNRVTCESMIYERLDPHAAFLIGQAKQSAARLGVPVPDWASKLPAATAARDGGGGEAADASTTDVKASAEEKGSSCHLGPRRPLGGRAAFAAWALVAAAVARGRRARKR